MGFQLKDIIDLEFLVELDEAALDETVIDETFRDADPEALAARDRDIFRQINDPELTDGGVIREWLSYRRLLYFHQAGAGQRLPGDLFDALTGWAGRGLFLAGLILGLVAAYSFLAYHGTRPVNVTVFICLFILLQALVSSIALTIMSHQAAGRPRRRPALFQALISAGVFKKLDQKFGSTAEGGGGAGLKRFGGIGALLRRVNHAHNGIMFWPFFILSCLFALGVSCGALGGTLFRVAVTDLAFGWQSTLLTSGRQVHELVSWMALPWSWGLPQALPGLEQIEGSRIVLKEGISGLASEHLTAWWPFLCMGLLVYGLGFRLLVAGLAFRCRAKALAAVDVSQARFQRLLVRMRSAGMETRVRDWPADRAVDPPIPPRPETGEIPGADIDEEGGHQRPANEDRPRSVGSEAVVLASEWACPQPALQGLVERVEGQLGLGAVRTAPVTFDVDRDRDRLQPLVQDSPGLTVVFLQEVWQPPIRGLLYYYTRIKAELFPQSRVWILLIQTPDQGDPAVSAADMNYKIWKTAVSRLNQPDLILERMLP